MNNTPTKLWTLTVILCAVVLCIGGFSYIVTHPWHVLPDIGGDGAKNNFTYLYHSLYGKGYWFTGMNYPYGEHIVYTDGMPLLSVLFAGMGNVSISAALTTAWWLVGISYVLSALYLSKTLLKFTGSQWFSLIFGVCIAFMSPQLLRLKGHYAMSFACIIPMLFYWGYRYRETGQYRYCIYSAIVGLLHAFLHPYFGGLLLIWAVFYGIATWLLPRATAITSKLKHAGGMLIAAIIVAVVVMTTMKLTDPVTDRPANPHNAAETFTNIPQIISSYYSPFWRIPNDKFWIPGCSNGGEGFAYPGAVPIGILLIVAGWSVWLITKRQKYILTTEQRFWGLLAVGALLFSMGVPFVWGKHSLTEHIPVFRQFRSLGRFAWIFYYVIAIVTCTVMYQWFGQLIKAGKKNIAWALMTLAALIWGAEVRGYMKFTRDVAVHGMYNYDLYLQNLEENWLSFMKRKAMQPNDFQSILLLPYFHVGSEKVWISEAGWRSTLGFRAALLTHLPLININMSRTSWVQSFKQNKIAAGPWVQRPSFADMKSDKPILLLQYMQDSLPPDQQYLIAQSDYVDEFSNCKVYVLQPGKLKRYTDSLQQAAKTIAHNMHATDTCVGSTLPYSVIHFEGEIGSGVAGKSIKGPENEQQLKICTINLGDTVAGKVYEFSCWFLLRRTDWMSPEVRLYFKDNSGNVIAKKVVETKQSADSYGMWFRAAEYVTIPAHCQTVDCVLDGITGSTYTAMDELLLRPAEGTVISKWDNGIIMVNNHHIGE